MDTARTFWTQLRQSLRDNPLSLPPHPDMEPEEVAGFNLARRAQGILLQHNLNPLDQNLDNLYLDIQNTLDGILPQDLDIEAVSQSCCAAWEDIRFPENADPFQIAILKAQRETQPAPGHYHGQKQRQLATLLWHILQHLPKDPNNLVFCSEHKLAQSLNLPRGNIRLALKALLRNHCLSVQIPSSEARARRFKITKIRSRGI